jgi:hypothetical protein
LRRDLAVRVVLLVGALAYVVATYFVWTRISIGDGDGAYLRRGTESALAGLGVLAALGLAVSEGMAVATRAGARVRAELGGALALAVAGLATTGIAADQRLLAGGPSGFDATVEPAAWAALAVALTTAALAVWRLGRGLVRPTWPGLIAAASSLALLVLFHLTWVEQPAYGDKAGITSTVSIAGVLALIAVVTREAIAVFVRTRAADRDAASALDLTAALAVGALFADHAVAIAREFDFRSVPNSTLAPAAWASLALAGVLAATSVLRLRRARG